MNIVPLIIDTDPGVDDALAILLAIAAGMPVAAITTVFGNADAEQTTQNALTLLELIGEKKIPVFEGASGPLQKSPRFAEAHGEAGFGGFELSMTRTKEAQSAADGMRSILESSGTDIACLGPLTNLATLLSSSNLASKIRTLIMLGGVIGERGNISPYAEFNVYNDPDALKLVLEKTNKGILIPANICRKVTFTKKDFDLLPAGKLRSGITQIVDFYIDYYCRDSIYGGFTGGVMYDVLTMAYLLKPELFTLKPACIAVNVSDSERRGETTVTKGKPNCRIATNVDAEGVKTLFFTAVSSKIREEKEE